MCKFFSLVSNGDGKPLYFDAKLRQEVKEKKLDYESDSHTSIADYFGYKGKKEDELNKYEYNPLTKLFRIDQKNNPKDDSIEIKKFCDDLDFKLIVPELRVHPIVNPFKDFSITEVTKEDLGLLKLWDSVWESVGDSVWESARDSVWESVRDSVGDSVWESVRASVRESARDSVWDSVGDSVRESARDSVGESVRDSVRASVWASVWDSVWGSVGAYTSSYFDIKYQYDFSSCIKLWNKGLIPSFDGKIWRLHGKNGKIIFEIEKDKLKGG